MAKDQIFGPDPTAVRAALWRAMHVQTDATPHVFCDEIGLQLAAPDRGWQGHPEMEPKLTAPIRASVVSRARFIEDLLADEIGCGIDQYVQLGAGLDTFVQRRPELVARLTVFEVDRPGPQAWKRQRFVDLGLDIDDALRLVPVDFETDSWWERLISAGFDVRRPAVVASTGVSMYLTREANIVTLRQLAQLAPGSTLVTTFMLPIELIGPGEQHLRKLAEAGASASGAPFISFFRPDEFAVLAEEAGFASATHVSATDLTATYFAGRTDGLRPAESEHILVAKT